MRTLIYKQYSGGAFVKDLDVTNEFYMSEEINKAGTEIVISLGVNLKDTDSANDPLFIVDEDANFIITEDGEELIAGTEVLVTGFPNIGDEIKVYQYDEYNPSGKIIFDGEVFRWKTKYSGNTTELYVRSKGLDLDNSLISILEGTVIAEQLTQDSAYIIYGEDKPTLDRLISVSQTFTVGANTTINGIYLFLNKTNASLATNVSAKIEVVEGTPASPGTILTTQTVIVSQETISLTFFQFTEEVSLIQSANYFFRVTNPFGSNLTSTNLISLYYNSAGGYADGQVYLNEDISGLSTPGTDLYFQLVTTTTGLGNVFNSVDPSTIATALIDNYVAAGGQVNYSDTSVATTNTLTSYTFKFNTFLDGLSTVVELAPTNWFFYVDVATNIFYFNKLPDTPDHYFTFGKEIIDVDIEYTLEKMANNVYVVGGLKPDGTSLIATSSDPDSIATYGQRLSTKVDNRITRPSTAQTIADNIIKDNRNPSFIIKIEVNAKDYDITSVRIGQLVGFRNSSGLVGDLEVLVVGKVYTPELVTLYLSTLPPSQSKRIQDINRNLKDKQTEDTPAD